MPYAIPLSKASNHPIMIGMSYNPRMGRWDISVEVGNFASEEEAREAAKGIRDAVSEHLGADLRKADAAKLEIKDN